jgi:glycosyltransferase involved in cell wall biosynthesis
MTDKSSKRLFYFTSSFPYGIGETWKSNELKFFIEYFDEITVVPHSYGGNLSSPKPLPPGVRLEGPLFESDGIALNKYSLLQLFDLHFFYYLRELFRRRTIFSKKKIISWLQASIHIKRLLRHPVIRRIRSHPDKDVVLYFFWGKGGCDFLPFIDKRKFGNIVVRFHRYDLFEDQNGGYIPYRKPLLESLGLAAPSSDRGLEHLRSLYPDVKTSMEVLRLGVIGEGEVRGSSDGVLRLLSCSYVVPVKRVHLIVEALMYLEIPVHWTHVGDGPLMNDLRNAAGHLPANVKVDFPGMVDTSELIDFYKAREIDIFLNVSSSEGVPMSIMECLAAGIPVFATAVGGTGEIVDDSVGKALRPDFTPEELAGSLGTFYRKTPEEKAAIRKAATRRYREKCDAERLTREFAEILIR